MTYKPKDHYFQKAKDQGFVARSVFKLQEADQRFKLLRPGYHVIDLGCAPGSWLQYASERVGGNGRVLGLDLTPCALNLANTAIETADIYSTPLAPLLSKYQMREQVDLVMSDMAPKTTGIRLTDQARSHQLCVAAFEVAQQHLRPGGAFICKFFQGEDFTEFTKELKKRFARVEYLKPKGTRTRSFEIFIIGLNFR